MKSTYQLIPTQQLDFDRENPRIKVALEKYGDKLDEERIRFALQTATEGSSTVSSYRSLKDSIRAARGISIPIVVWPDKDRFVCVDGNTRLAIYHELDEENTSGNWSAINCLVLNNPEPREIETIRVTAHLVGAREWPAYEKARYLHYLRNVEFMDYDELIARCGGNKTTITQQIDAYRDMNEFYRDVNSDDAFKVDRFSGFVELQKTDIKDAIYSAGYDLKDFGRWIRDGQIYRLADVRKLPRVLVDDDAKTTFVNGGLRSIEDAVAVAEANRHKDVHPSPLETSVATASMATLAEALLEKIKSLPRHDYVALRDRQYETADQDIDTLSDLAEHLHDLLPRCRKVTPTGSWCLPQLTPYNSVTRTFTCKQTFRTIREVRFPKFIRGFRPDIVARARTTCVELVIAEAKTDGDIDNKHTRNQIRAIPPDLPRRLHLGRESEDQESRSVFDPHLP